MTCHTAPLNRPYSVVDIDSSRDSISVAIAADKTIEFMVVDHSNRGPAYFSSMNADAAMMAYAKSIAASEKLRDM